MADKSNNALWPDPQDPYRKEAILSETQLHPPITIAMASYNGARFIRAQLDSLAAQSISDWKLIVSDDGSTDGTRQIVAEFARTRPSGQVELIDGPRQGSTRNFLHLTQRVDAGGWLAYADQDDVWLPDRLERGVAFLHGRIDAAIYAARTTICDEALNPLAAAPHFPGPFTFRNALIQACLPGNTILANSQAIRLLQATAPAAEAAGIISHDWWAYQILSGAGASIMRDRAQVLLYRQHRKNLMGRNDTARAKAARASMLINGKFADWLARNQKALEPVTSRLLPENQRLLERFGEILKASGPNAFHGMLRLRLYRQTRTGTLAVLAAALTGRLRIPDPKNTS
ncbi:glycosyltransferase [Paracoccus kondratievae]|uniref:glycosyltransferase n=1 Tax=Paracoccus kondratievae TaxID=135740 RepID=UPI0012664A8D|nr:glycosyltransferase [Paracoccus kondratievae]QFQ87467.1 glycosyltransferase [Paracoccus kondratievae]